MLETSTNIYALTFLEAGNAWHDVKNFNPFRPETFGRCGCPHLPSDDWYDGYRLGIRFRQSTGDKSAGGSRFHFVLGQEF